MSRQAGRQRPRVLTSEEHKRLEEFIPEINYSSRYADSINEYRHVMLPKAMLDYIPDDFKDETGLLRILQEEEWRSLGITQSLGWEHYEVHAPEPHILLFKRPKNYGQPQPQ
ncbi:hypothetical protein ABW19_dt0203546 [Dactylella cylindrospora]|nr:hypothetical protein ABW19_dt0203546 [Dactylella cylindrospora]